MQDKVACAEHAHFHIWSYLGMSHKHEQIHNKFTNWKSIEKVDKFGQAFWGYVTITLVDRKKSLGDSKWRKQNSLSFADESKTDKNSKNDVIWLDIFVTLPAHT